MIVLVSGSLEWTDGDAIERRLRQLPRGTKIVHGDAQRGADKLADTIARRLGFDVFPCPADWSVKDYTPPQRVRTGRYGKPFDIYAGKERTGQMIDGTHANSPGEPELVLAFQLNGSGGTQAAIDGAAVRGIKVEIDRRYR